MMATEKHNLRIPEGVWDAASKKAERLRKAGHVIDEGHKPGLIDVTKIVRAALVEFAAETDIQTIRRLGLKKAA